MDIIAVVGPTATGKSDLAVQLAHHLGGPGSVEVINADAYQLYRGMDIGTAKMAPSEQLGIRHHLFDVLDPREDASVASYQVQSRNVLEDIYSRSMRPIVVGGSGLYVRAMLDDMNFPGTDPEIRARLEAEALVRGTRVMYEQLLAADPSAAHSIGTSNERRIIRALEVIELTGMPFSANLPKQEYVRPTLTLGLDFDRTHLDERIELRVARMFDQGLVDEVTTLVEHGMGRTASRAVGYAEVIEYLEGKVTLDQAQENIVINTRRLTRKQMGWFGRDPRIVWLDGASEHVLADAIEAVARHDQGVIAPVASGPVRRSLGS